MAFTPTVEGDASDTLTLQAQGHTFSIALTGRGVARVTCPEPAPCHVVDYDPDGNACADRALDDGSACGSDCVVGGVCRYDGSGQQLYRCDLGDSGWNAWEGSALGTNRWFVARILPDAVWLEAYDLPDTQPAAHGGWAPAAPPASKAPPVTIRGLGLSFPSSAGPPRA